MRVAVAWIASLLGFGVLYVVFLGRAMSTAPGRLGLEVVAGLAILPLLALYISGTALHQAYAAHTLGPALVRYLIPLALALLSLSILLFELMPL